MATRSGKTQAERNRESMQKLGKKNKAFVLDMETIALFERLAAHTGKTQVDVLKDALAVYAQSKGIAPGAG